MSTPTAQKPRGAGQCVRKVTFDCELYGCKVRFEGEFTMEALLDMLIELEAKGARFGTMPLVWDKTPEGLPLCPKHRVPMLLRDKQGQQWYSHRCFDAHGQENWCRGFPGPLSPGWDCRDLRGPARTNGGDY